MRNEDDILPKLLKIVPNTAEMLFELPRTVLRLKKFANKSPISPLASNYWSSVPFALGDGCAVKYAVLTDRANSPEAQVGVDTQDGLSVALRTDLAHAPARYVFGVHVQTDPVKQPIEDATVPWWPDSDPTGAAFMVPLADLVVTGMDEDADALGQNLVFSAWNVLAAHKPLGAMNRARREVYKVMAMVRNQVNGVEPPGSTDAPT